MLKIADFGCAVVENPLTLFESEVGTLEFQAPELVLGARTYDHTIDLWSAGVVVTELASALPIFGTQPKNLKEQFIRIAKVRNINSSNLECA